MIEIRKTATFSKWIDSLRDIRARARVQARIERLAVGHAGDARPVGEGVSELRIGLTMVPDIGSTSRSKDALW